jgi:hypothetical protein
MRSSSDTISKRHFSEIRFTRTHACTYVFLMVPFLEPFRPKYRYMLHPLQGSELVNEFPRREILGKQSFAGSCNNRGGCVFYVVRVSQQQNNGVMLCVSKQRNCKHVYNNRCFPWILCRELIREVNSDASSVQGSYEPSLVIAEDPWIKDTKPSWKGVVRIQLWSVNGRWRCCVCCSAVTSGVIWSASPVF